MNNIFAQPAPGVGAQNAAAPGLFGQSGPMPPFNFNTPAKPPTAGGLFATTPGAAPFGATNPPALFASTITNSSLNTAQLFGTNKPNTSPFNTNATQPPGGMFGGDAGQQKPLFGTGNPAGLFGTAPATTPFGTAPPSTSGMLPPTTSTTPFNVAPGAAPFTGQAGNALFGQNTAGGVSSFGTAGGGLFGTNKPPAPVNAPAPLSFATGTPAAPTTTPFGGNATGSLFGTGGAAAPFGNNQNMVAQNNVPAIPLFGNTQSQTNAPTPFGTNPAPSLFSTNSAPSLFTPNQPALAPNTQNFNFSQPPGIFTNSLATPGFGQGQRGTSTVRYNISNNKKNNKVHCINFMAAYEGKSLLELRLEDYLAAKQNQLRDQQLANFTAYVNKYAQNGNVVSSFAPQGGGSAPGLFNTNPIQPNNLFNQGMTTPNSLFPQSQQGTNSLFPQTTTLQNNLFVPNANPQNSLFPPALATNNLFNQTITPQNNLFTTNTPAQNNLFTTNTPAQNNLFTTNTPGTNSLFPSAPNSLFPSAPNSLFPAATNTLFPAAPAPAQNTLFPANQMNSVSAPAQPQQTSNVPFSFANNQNLPFALYYMPLNAMTMSVPPGMPAELRSLALKLPQQEEFRPVAPLPEAFPQRHSLADLRLPSALTQSIDRRRYFDAQRRARRRLIPPATPTVMLPISAPTQALTVELLREGCAPKAFTERALPSDTLSHLLRNFVTVKRVLSAEEVRRARFSANGKDLELFDTLEGVLNDKAVLVIELNAARACSFTLGGADFRLQPSLEELTRMDAAQLARVDCFSVSNEHARVDFLAPVDLREVDLSAVVRLRYKLVEVYPPGAPKPAVGRGLNVPARITYLNFELPEGGEELAEMRRRVTALAAEMSAEVENVDAAAQTVSITVPHF